MFKSLTVFEDTSNRWTREQLDEAINEVKEIHDKNRQKVDECKDPRTKSMLMELWIQNNNRLNDILDQYEKG